MRLLEAKERVIPDSLPRQFPLLQPCVILILQKHKSNPETSGICKLNNVVFSKISMKMLWDLEIHLTLDSQLRIYSISRCFWQQKFPSFSKQKHIQIWQLKLLINFLSKKMVGGHVNSDWGRQHFLLMTPKHWDIDTFAFETETAPCNMWCSLRNQTPQCVSWLTTRTGSGEAKYCHGCLVHRAKKAWGEQWGGGWTAPK